MKKFISLLLLVPAFANASGTGHSMTPWDVKQQVMVPYYHAEYKLINDSENDNSYMFYLEDSDGQRTVLAENIDVSARSMETLNVNFNGLKQGELYKTYVCTEQKASKHTSLRSKVCARLQLFYR